MISMCVHIFITVILINFNKFGLSINEDDIECCKKLNIDIDYFRKWFDHKLVLPEYNSLVNKFAKCWFGRRHVITAEDVINWTAYYEWINVTAYKGIDTENLNKDDMNKRKDMIDDIIPKCKSVTNWTDLENYRIIFYNCVAKQIYNIHNLDVN
ncbi:hypothetical protein FQR65_LT03299 [Abscondita terminalis]|nr:hypothetical protein FQR65_LT03299 [Abscondita terminalis]